MDFLEGILYMLWRGIAIGVIISAPMGPVGILCVQRTLEKGRNTGFFTGVGAAVSDLFYCLLTGFGLSFIEDFLKANQNVIQIIGSVVLVIFGFYLFRSNPTRSLKAPDTRPPSKGRNVLSGFLFTFSNPLIIFLIIGLFARFNFSLPEITLVHYLVGYIFIFVGALMWWWVVSWFVDKVRNHFNLRSMWLINKITGGIIMIFALVGIITAISGIASAARREPVVISNSTADTIYRNFPLKISGDFSVSFRVSNLHNQPLRHYAYTDADGKKRKTLNPTWGFALHQPPGERVGFHISTLGDPMDPVIPLGLKISSLGKSSEIGEGVDFGTGPNSFRICRKNGLIAISVGNRAYKEFTRFDASDINPDSICFIVPPGGEIKVEHFSVESEGEDMHCSELSAYADKSYRDSVYMRSADEMEGEWRMFDRMLDDDRLRIGGEYRLASIRSGRGYDFIYLQGAEKRSDVWKPGMLKCRLEETDFQGIFDVEWLDPDGRKLRGVIKAQIESPDVIGFQFSDHGSSVMRLRKVPVHRSN